MEYLLMRLDPRRLAKFVWPFSFLVFFSQTILAQQANSGQTPNLREPQTFAEDFFILGQLPSPQKSPIRFDLRNKPITALACSADGVRLAVAEDDSTIALRNTETGHLLRRIVGPHGKISSMAFHPDGQRLVTTSFDGDVSDWNVATGERIREFQSGGEWVTSVVFAPDGRTVAVGGYDKTVQIFDYDSGLIAKTLDALAAVRSVTFSSDGQLLAAGCLDGVRIWKTAEWSLAKSQTEKTGKYGPVNVVAFSSTGKFFAAGCDNGNISLWDTEKQETEPWVEGKLLIAHPYLVTGLKFLNHDKSMISCSADGKVITWDPTAHQPRQIVHQHKNAITGLVVLPNSRALITAGADRAIKIRLGIVPDVFTLPIAERKGKLVGMSPDGNSVVMLEGNSKLQFMDVAGGDLKQHIDNQSPVVYLAHLPAGRLCVASSDKQIRVWEIGSQKMLAQFPTGASELLCLDVSGDGNRLLVGSADGIWRLYDISDLTRPQEVVHSSAQSLPITKVALSPDGKWIAAAANLPSDWRKPGEAKLWNAATGQEVAVLGQHAAQIQGVSFDPSSRLLASYGDFSSVRVWDIETRRELPAVDIRGNVAGAAFTADSRGLIIAHSDGKLSCWSLEQRAAYRKFDGHLVAIDSLWFSQDRRIAATRDIQNTVKLWSMHDAATK